MSAWRRGASRQDSRWQWRGYGAGSGRCGWRQPGWWPGLQEKVRWWLRAQPGFQDQGEGCVPLSSSASSCQSAPLPSSGWSNVLDLQPGGEHVCTISSEQSAGRCHHLGLAPAVELRWWDTPRARGWARRLEGPRAAPDLASEMSPVSTKGWSVSCRQWQMADGDP